MSFTRRTADEKAALRAEKAQRKAEIRERLQSQVKETRETEEQRRREALTAVLQADEPVVALFKTAEALMKKYVLFTPKRLLVASVHSPSDAESIPYRSITSFAASNFITKDIKLTVAGRKDTLELSFDDASERDEAMAVLNTNVL